jgi:hypothetical protein
MEDLFCPKCGEPLTEEMLKKSLVCPYCKTNLRDQKYLSFLELLVYNDIIDNIDFFDINLYRDEILNEERDDYDEPDIDPAKFEKRKEVWNEFEDELESETTSESEEETEDAWDIFGDDMDFADDLDDLEDDDLSSD